jgi:hypothetical protein
MSIAIACVQTELPSREFQFPERSIFACLYHSETPGIDVEIIFFSRSVIFGCEVASIAVVEALCGM